MFSSSALLLVILVIFGSASSALGQDPAPAPHLAAIRVSSPNTPIVAGDSVRLLATGVYSDGSTKDITNLVTWTGTSGLTATVAEGGVVSAITPGNASITAAAGGVSGTSAITITSKCGAGQYPDDSGKCESTAAALSSGLLMQFGLSAGIAVALHTPLSSHTSVSASDSYLTAASATPMGYAAVFPAYWFWTKDRRTQCSRSVFETDTQATRDATTAYVGANPAAAATPGTPKNGTTLLHCVPGDIGFYVGVPSSFQANTVLTTAYSVTNPASRTVRPLISFGLALAPFPWINLLMGLTYSNVQADTFPGAPATGPKSLPPDLQVWSWLFGLGGPFDVASLFIGGK
jgi:hypothetical protein